MASKHGNPSQAGVLPAVLVSIQYLRAMAAMLVVYYHATIQIDHLSVSGLRLLPVFGKSGVDIFFILSGYVMWASTSQHRFSLAGFARRRIVRIVPLYWLMTALAAGCALIIPDLLRSTRFEWPHFLASLFFIPWTNPASPFGDDLISPLIIPGWTLNFEVLFYILFAISCALSAHRLWRIFVLSASITMVYFLSKSFSNCAVAAQFFSNDIVFEFVFGVLLAALIQRYLTFPLRAVVIVSGASVAFLILDDWGQVDLPRAIALGIPSFFVVAAAINWERQGSVPFYKLGDLIGNASYSLYLTHIFVVTGARTLILMLHPINYKYQQVVAVCIIISISLLVAVITHCLVEKPLVKRLARSLDILGSAFPMPWSGGRTTAEQANRTVE